MSRNIDIRVLDCDAMSVTADVLVLKYAQALHGLDARIVERAGLNPGQLPEPDEFRLLESPTTIQASALIFIGTRPMSDFSYADVRKFGSLALRCVASVLPDTREVALTLHGVGFGLDEVECFESELAGVLDAIRSEACPPSLETVTFVEAVPARARRLRDILDRTLGDHPAVTVGGHDPAISTGAVQRLARAGTPQGARPHAFVAMPFDESFDDLFHYGISGAVRSAGLLCERVDQQAFTGDVLERMKTQIAAARLVLADVTDANANVYLEVGLAWGLGVPTVLVCRKGSDLKFDIQSQRCLFYTSIKHLEQQLEQELRALV